MNINSIAQDAAFDKGEERKFSSPKIPKGFLLWEPFAVLTNRAM